MNEVAQDGLSEEDFTGDSIEKDRETLGTWDSVKGRLQLSVKDSSTANVFCGVHGMETIFLLQRDVSSKNRKSHRVMLKA